MAKLDVIAHGRSIMDDWGKSSDGTIGFKITGNAVERLTSDGHSYTSKAIGEPIKNLYWDKNGSIYALTESGKVEYCGKLSPDPNAGYKAEQMELGKSEQPKSKTRKEKSIRTKSSGKKISWWKWPFKLLWWCIKGLASILMFGALISFMDKNKD